MNDGTIEIIMPITLWEEALTRYNTNNFRALGIQAQRLVSCLVNLKTLFNNVSILKNKIKI